MITLQEDELQGKKVIEIKKIGVLSVAKICAFLYLKYQWGHYQWGQTLKCEKVDKLS